MSRPDVRKRAHKKDEAQTDDIKEREAHKSRGRSRTPRAAQPDYDTPDYRSGDAYKQGKYGHLVE